MPKYLAQSSAAPRGVAAGSMDVGRLYRRHHPWLVGWLRRKLADGQDAADVSHDTFLRLLSLDNLDSLREPRAYLLVIASRLLINGRRRDRVENESEHWRGGHGRWTSAGRFGARSGNEL